MNPNFQEYNGGEMIIGKSTSKVTNFDLLVYCKRDIKFAKIPRFIEHIYSYVFYSYKNLQIIEIQSDSKLQTIGEHSFSESCIRSITIPSKVTNIEEKAFAYCENLKKFKTSNNWKRSILLFSYYKYINSITSNKHRRICFPIV